MKRWILDILISLDQLANVLLKWPLNKLFGLTAFGNPDETISSVLGRHYASCPLCRAVCRVLSKLLGNRHCREAIEIHEDC